MKIKLSTAITILINLIYLFGAISSNNILCILASAFFLLSIMSQPVEDDLCLLLAMSANQAIVVSMTGGISLIGVGYLFILFKIILCNRSNGINIPGIGRIIIPCSGVLAVGLSLFFRYSSFYDFALAIELLIVMMVYLYFFNYHQLKIKQMIDSFVLGTVLCAVNIVVGMFVSGYSSERINGIMDNANYMAISFVFAAVCCLMFYCYNIQSRKYFCFFLLFTIMSLTTGSRGAAVSLVAALIWIMIFGFKRLGKARTLIFIIILGLISFYVLYIANVRLIVDIYNNLIGRTLEKLFSDTSNQFMDVSSGRTMLWAFYLEQLKSDNLLMLFGKGSNIYYLREFGGYGFFAHNVWIGSFMGIGLLGTISTIMMYIGFAKSVNRSLAINENIELLFFSLIIVVLIGYFFLDGIYDMRIVVYIVMFLLLEKRITDYNSIFVINE